MGFDFEPYHLGILQWLTPRTDSAKGPVAAANEDFILDDDLTTNALLPHVGSTPKPRANPVPSGLCSQGLAALSQPGLGWVRYQPRAKAWSAPCRPPALGSVTCGLAETPPSRAHPGPSASGSPSPLRLGRLLSQDQQGRRWWTVQSAFLCFAQGWTSDPAVLHTMGHHANLGNRSESVTEQDNGNTESKTPPGPRSCPIPATFPRSFAHTPVCLSPLPPAAEGSPGSAWLNPAGGQHQVTAGPGRSSPSRGLCLLDPRSRARSSPGAWHGSASL